MLRSRSCPESDPLSELTLLKEEWLINIDYCMLVLILYFSLFEKLLYRFWCLKTKIKKNQLNETENNSAFWQFVSFCFVLRGTLKEKSREKFTLHHQWTKQVFHGFLTWWRYPNPYIQYIYLCILQVFTFSRNVHITLICFAIFMFYMIKKLISLTW